MKVIKAVTYAVMGFSPIWWNLCLKSRSNGYCCDVHFLVMILGFSSLSIRISYIVVCYHEGDKCFIFFVFSCFFEKSVAIFWISKFFLKIFHSLKNIFFIKSFHRLLRAGNLSLQGYVCWSSCFVSFLFTESFVLSFRNRWM